MRTEDLLTIVGKDEIVALAQVSKQVASGASARLTRKAKEQIFEAGAQLKKGFSYGYATYPDDADNSKDLLEQARNSCDRERKARFRKAIMIVDDEPEVRNSLKKELRASGYSNFSEAGDGEEALEKIRAAIPDLLILDLNMPRISGYELIGMLKENPETENIATLIMSGFAAEIESLKEYVKKKSIPVIGKPLDMEQFRKLVNYLL
jgi:CheY-like chemotaxis protein